jgi:serine/threonine-protein kinase PknG
VAIRFRMLAAASFIMPLAFIAGCTASQAPGAPAGTAPGQSAGAGTIPGTPAPAAVSLPGELAPKLRLTFAAQADDAEKAARYFRLVWTIDRSYVRAAFGLARTRLKAGDRAGAIAALTSVPATSSHYIAAQVAAVRVRVSPSADQAYVSADDLREAGHGFSRLTLDQTAVQQITAEVLQAALKRILAREPTGSEQLLGCDMTERALRFGLERSCRAEAQLSSDGRRRTMLVDMANEIRPSTWS